MPLDPGREWLAAGITGIPRQREWDAVAVVPGPGEPGDEVELVVLPDGSLVQESDGAPAAAAFLLEAIGLEPPFRVVARRRDDLWAVGAVAIEVVQLDPNPDGSELELTWSRSVLALSIDGAPADPGRAAALERIAAARVSGPYAAHAHRLRGDLWELSVLRL
jgi:hypothetical protein